ncbi:WD40/YVTN/BNR-like repeat-containing protein [Streptomyces sp. NPDC057686]|uniref:WD40/YVTN/BNR-like repeat-containing protein n=1 Tax=Streptomyces sp. NPDC057686 TaxID=3346212 RepID=UPI0036B787E4
MPASSADAEQWELVGPLSSAATVQCLPRPDGGSVILTTSPTTMSNFWSEDSGNTWHAIEPPTRYPVGTALVGSQVNPWRWWLATASLPGAHKAGVFRTDDEGESWERLDVELPESDYFQSLSAHRDGRVLVGLTAGGDTFVSRDGGDTWQVEDLTGGRPVFKLVFLGDDLVFQPSQEGALYAVRDASGEPQPPVALKFLEAEQVLLDWDADGRTVGRSGRLSWETRADWPSAGTPATHGTLSARTSTEAA